MGDASAPTSSESTQEMLKAYTAAMPGLMQAYQQNILPNEQAQLAASQAVSPGYNQLQSDLYKQYGPQLAQTGVDINKVNELGQIGTDTSALQAAQQSGGLLDQTRTAQDAADPEAAKYRALASQKVSDLLNSINLNGLSGSERAEVERSNARDNVSRGTETPTATSTVSNAMNFGSALQGKRTALGNALTQSAQVAPGLSNGINAFTTTTGRSSSANTGIPQFGGTTQTGSSTQSQGTNLLNQIGQFQNTKLNIDANRRDTMDRVGQGVGMVGSLAGSAAACCWLFMEAYNGEIPPWVRKFRDATYTPELRGGYRVMSKILVPLMRKSSFIRSLVNELVIVPITAYSGYIYKISGYEAGKKYDIRTKLLLKTWSILGHVFGPETHINPLKTTKSDFVLGL
jgi:hypothetical protein